MSNSKPKKLSASEKVADRLIKSLEQGTIPWRQPWQSAGAPTSFSTGKRYRGANILTLLLTAAENGYKSNLWITHNQARQASFDLYCKEKGITLHPVKEATTEEAAGHKYRGVKKGEKGTAVFFWKRIEMTDRETGEPILDARGKQKTRLYPFGFTVFNMEQTDLPVPENGEQRDHSPEESAELIMAGYFDRDGGPDFATGGLSAYYRPATDEIQVPAPEDFETAEDYYHTVFHEAGHSTGHASRLNREGIQKPDFGSETYAKEELIAEITAALLSGEAGLANPDLNDREAAYVANWLKVLKDDPSMITKAATAASAAADHIQGVTYGKKGSDREAVAA